jgi:23S rRNA G2445 N2-methylase RlmL
METATAADAPGLVPYLVSMARSSPRKSDSPLPACYATVQPGLEPVAADEITRDLGGEVKKTSRGVVVFRLDSIDERVLSLRTTEDVFLLAWGSDSLSYSSNDLNTIRTWTARKADWAGLFRHHHAVRPVKGKPTFHLVCQLQGEHGYRRVDALDALADGLAGKVPAGWRPADENAWLEIWLSIQGKTAVCGVRLTDRTMRHRTYKTEHVAASLRPTVAAAMVRLAGAGPGMTVLDPMCGAGTILAEQIGLARKRKAGAVTVLGGDVDPNAVFCAGENLASVGPAELARWDATALPLPAAAVDRIVSNPPFGKQLSTPEEIGPLYFAMVREADRVLKPGGRAVYLVGDDDAIREAAADVGWVPNRHLRVRVLGQAASLGVWHKPG